MAPGWHQNLGQRSVRLNASPTSSTVYIYSGSKLIAEYVGGSPATSPAREYVYAGERIVGTFDGAPHFEMSDHLSGRATADAAGIVTSESGHYPFGEPWYQVGPSDEQLFTSYKRDSEESSPFLVETLHGSSLITRLPSLCCSSSRSSVRVSAPREAWRDVDTL